MPASGSRKSHTKSRKGCRTCKRRHIRCDESFPQCRNCTKHNVRCDYMDASLDGLGAGGEPDLGTSLQDKRELEQWIDTGEYPFPNLGLQGQIHPLKYTPTELRLIHHVSTVATQMQNAEPDKYSIWTKRVPMFLRMAVDHEYVMHSLLALSASHLSWLTSCPATMHLAYQYQGFALKGLQEAIGAFSKGNSDAVLASSILLSWQATDWQTWASLMQGTTTVISAMEGWKHESEFGEFIDEKIVFSAAPHQPQIEDPERDRQVLNHVYSALKQLEPYVVGKDEETRGLNELTNFVQNLQSFVPFQSEEEQFEFIHPLRTWLFFLPIDFLKRVKRDPSVMVLLAHFYGVALAVEPLFPAVGAAHFGSMSLGPVENILQNLLRQKGTMDSGELEWSISLMEFPLEMVYEFRQRMSWRTAQSIGEDRDEDEGMGMDMEAVNDPKVLHAPICTNLDGFDVSAFAGFGPLHKSPSASSSSAPTSVGRGSHGN